MLILSLGTIVAEHLLFNSQADRDSCFDSLSERFICIKDDTLYGTCALLVLTQSVKILHTFIEENKIGEFF